MNAVVRSPGIAMRLPREIAEERRRSRRTRHQQRPAPASERAARRKNAIPIHQKRDRAVTDLRQLELRVCRGIIELFDVGQVSAHLRERRRAGRWSARAKM